MIGLTEVGSTVTKNGRRRSGDSETHCWAWAIPPRASIAEVMTIGGIIRATVTSISISPRIATYPHPPAKRPNVPLLFSYVRPSTIPLMLYELPHHELSDAEIAAIRRDIIAGAGRSLRSIELCFTGICAEQQLLCQTLDVRWFSMCVG